MKKEMLDRYQARSRRPGADLGTTTSTQCCIPACTRFPIPPHAQRPWAPHLEADASLVVSRWNTYGEARQWEDEGHLSREEGMEDSSVPGRPRWQPVDGRLG